MAGANGSSRWTDALLDRMQSTGDDCVDKRVRKVFEDGGVDAVNDIMRRLVRNDQPVPEELPAEIRDYLAGAWPCPSGPTWERSSAGSSYTRHGAS